MMSRSVSMLFNALNKEANWLLLTIKPQWPGNTLQEQLETLESALFDQGRNWFKGRDWVSVTVAGRPGSVSKVN